MSRTQFYELRKTYLKYGADALRPKPTASRPGRPPQESEEQTRRVLALALSWPTWGPKRLSDQLGRDPEPVTMAPTTIWRLLHRHGLGRRAARLAVLKQHSAEAAGLLTERTRRTVAHARSRQRHVAAEQPGQLLCLDTFYIGKLKGVGKIWPITACDAACSYAWAEVVVALSPSATQVVDFVTRRVVPDYTTAGWTLQRVLTDGGTEFKGAFRAFCETRGLRHTRIKPGHAWTNGYVERLQGTILHEHWRIVFRRQYFTRLVTLQRSLDGFLRFYHGRRPHQAYKLRGQMPGARFWGVADVAHQVA
jgi:transposase InsO family protein